MKKLLYIALLAIIFVGCDDRLEDLNTDKVNPAKVDPSSLFTQALRESFDMMVSTSVNENTFRLYVQYWAQTTYPEESQYNLATRNIPLGFWINGYRDALIDFKEANKLLEAELETATADETVAINNQMASVEIMSVYVFASLVDAFGDIPYSEALDPENLNPKYDDAAGIYDDLLSRLDAAMGMIDEGASGFSSTQDVLYGGDMSSWMTFANSLKFRMGMRLADVNSAKSVSVVNSALAAGVISSNSENVSMPYLGSSPNTNPVYAALVLSGRSDYIAANTIVDQMNALNDPRRPVYFRENLGDGVFDGGIYGTANNYSAFTQVGDIFHTPDLPGTIMNYAEMEFLMAEAAERGGYNVTGTAAEHYNAGIMASFDQWGADGAADYLAQPSVAYATAAGNWKQKIGTQLWLALYNQGFEAWNSWKRLDYPSLTPAEEAATGIPVRFTYPLEEAQLNGEMMSAAASKIGGDEVSTHVFWDVN